MRVPLYQVDAFTAEVFKGNPAAICVLPGPRDERWMQDVAREMNLSETAFLNRREDGFELRWFTPAIEVELCGHATLASAHVLWEGGYLDPTSPARFHTRSGILTAGRRGDWIELDFPADPDEPASEPPGLARALGVELKYVGKGRFDYLVEVESEEVLRNMEPDFKVLRSISSRGVIVTSPSATPDYNFTSRFFAPQSGVDEDPVTGSAHCCLGPFWGKRLGKSPLVGFQASERGGVVRVRMAGDRVILGGQAVTVLRGELW